MPGSIDGFDRALYFSYTLDRSCKYYWVKLKVSLHCFHDKHKPWHRLRMTLYCMHLLRINTQQSIPLKKGSDLGDPQTDDNYTQNCHCPFPDTP